MVHGLWCFLHFLSLLLLILPLVGVFLLFLIFFFFSSLSRYPVMLLERQYSSGLVRIGACI